MGFSLVNHPFWGYSPFMEPPQSHQRLPPRSILFPARPFLRNSRENNATRSVLQEVGPGKSWGIPGRHHGCHKSNDLDDWGVYTPLFSGNVHVILIDISWSKLDEHPRNCNEGRMRFQKFNIRNSGDVVAPRILLLSNGRAKHGYDNQLRSGTNLKV